VDQDDKVDDAMIANKKAIKEGKAHNIGGLNMVKSTMKWPLFMSTFVLNSNCEIIKSGMRTQKGLRRCT
jgi:hypothetical protein